MDAAEQAAIGVRIRAARRARGWTQDRLAEVIGVSRSAVAQWETGRAGQVSENLARIAGAFGIAADWLLRGAEAGGLSPGGFSAGGVAPGGSIDDMAAVGGDELALLRLYRACEAEDRQILLRTARRLAGGAARL